ncbi:Stk1 family PASTA domain-containing Ser/Thr kinase [Paenibacillus thermotolerans]|uniref:Stk1 family PASTA domain-containing Ser/Thr kinase n=1 Tax=Paenibacillus thermotolerans TaxID=3027807 RepID=UPI002368DD19|nr:MULTISPECIES: Stk1 family PASTA domain-containing Ser/Thr kinase [unclassified Paenibacillus]
MTGNLLAGRYEMLERVGGGGMALVYKARDTLLNRNVAVKVLRQQYVHDEEFVRRFRREAQSAASLSHPNVVNVYDVGQDEETHFIVMEFVEGSNLNDIIKEQAPLQVERAVRIAAQICDALGSAHANGIIHRDIKPHNILIGTNGRVKVTDFGIARAATSSSITQTGSVIGSVHYFSPEHAKGVSAGEKSDIYSVGIVLYQMLTGRLPFLGESPISVALKHLQENVEEPRSVNAMIPQSVENIILKAMRKKPEERYSTAGEMLRDLETCLSPQRVNEPKWTYAGDDGHDEDATRIMPAIRGLEPQDKASSDEARAGGEAPVWRDDKYEEPGQEKRKNPWVKPVIWFAVMLLLLGGAWYGVQAMQKALVIPEVRVPDVTGLPLEKAKADLEAVQLKVADPVFEFNRDVPENYVIRQDKMTPDTAKIHTEIRLFVSKGIQKVIMPPVEGEKLSDAIAALEEAGIPGDKIEKKEQASDQDPGTVLQQFPSADEEIDPLSSSVTLIVSKGRDQVAMPDLIGRDPNEARALLERENLVLKEGNIIKDKAYFPVGKVFKQFPYEPGQMVTPPGDEIQIYVSSGLPDDARVTNYDVTVGPQQDGVESVIRIVVSDAMGDSKEAVRQKVTQFETFSVELVTSPSKNAVIEIYRDDVKIGHYTWTNRQAKESGGSASTGFEPEPAQEPPAAENPPADAADDSADGLSEDVTAPGGL